jgi:lysophospholipase L1-like esterase
LSASPTETTPEKAEASPPAARPASRGKELAQGLLAFGAMFLVFFLLTEVATRVYTKVAIFYDVEMTRYGLEIKEPAGNPRIGHVHRPSSKAHLMGTDVSINSDGFRDKEYAREKAAGTRRIVVLGDSLTFGWGVEQHESFEHLLEQKMNQVRPTEAINFGHGNYNTDQEVSLFEEKGLAYKPDQVALFYFINDAEPTPERSSWGFLGGSRAITFFWSKIKSAKANLFPTGSFLEFYSGLYTDGRPGWEATKGALVRLAKLCNREGIELSVVILPELHHLKDYPFGDAHAKVRAVLEGEGVPVLDLAGKFPADIPPTELWVALDDAHPNARAHEMIANLALPFLMSSGEVVP